MSSKVRNFQLNHCLENVTWLYNLSASVLCKQEEFKENGFAMKVFKAIKTEFHTKISGNYPKSH